VVAYEEARVHLSRRGRGAAARSLHEALRLDPGYEPARALLSKVEPSR
jgi:hypothetical protein